MKKEVEKLRGGFRWGKCNSEPGWQPREQTGQSEPRRVTWGRRTANMKQEQSSTGKGQGI